MLGNRDEIKRRDRRRKQVRGETNTSLEKIVVRFRALRYCPIHDVFRVNDRRHDDNNSNNNNNNNKSNNNHFILGRSVSPSKWTHCGEGFSPLWGGGLVMPTIRPSLSQRSRPMPSSHYILEYGRPGNICPTGSTGG